jgi:DNA (cytosine-5)-methyltransferase 1
VDIGYIKVDELSLFSGAGGGLLGSILLGWRPIGYVEINEYCQRVIAQRIKDGILPEAPIFGDIRTFISEGYAESYTGMVDVITAGFPCQPFSVAGKREGSNDDRNLWPETITSIRIIRPQFVLLENVPGLLSSGYFGQILGDLAESGYNARWKVLSAAEVGAPHKRDRIWIFAYSNGNRRRTEQKFWPKCENKAKFGNDGKEKPLAYTQECDKGGLSLREEKEQSGLGIGSKDVCHPTVKGFQNRINQKVGRCKKRNKELQLKRSNWWEIKPNVGRVADGISSRVDRLKVLGNGQVPQVVEKVWKILTEPY